MWGQCALGNPLAACVLAPLTDRPPAPHPAHPTTLIQADPSAVSGCGMGAYQTGLVGAACKGRGPWRRLTGAQQCMHDRSLGASPVTPLMSRPVECLNAAGELATQVNRDLLPALRNQGVKLYFISIGTYERGVAFCDKTGEQVGDRRGRCFVCEREESSSIALVGAAGKAFCAS